MKKRFFTAIICLGLFLGQSLTCFATGRVEPPSPTPNLAPPTPIPVPVAPPASAADPTTAERPPFLDHIYPAALNLHGDNWGAYNLADNLGNPYELTMLFGDFPVEITITADEPELYQAKLLEKTALVNGEFELTDNLRDLLLVPADGGHFPHTKYNPNKQFIGTIQPQVYNGVVHTIQIGEVYTVQPGDTLGQIILDCGWLPEGAHLYGPDGYLTQHFDYTKTLYPGDEIYWRSEEIRIIDNLYPDIEISIIPGNLFSYAEPATLVEEANNPIDTGALDSIPIISDLLKILP